MIKYFETFKEKSEPKVGDYVICKEKRQHYSLTPVLYDNALTFIDNNVGQIYSIDSKGQYFVEYFNVPFNIRLHFDDSKYADNCRLMLREEILYFSSSKEEMELKLLSMKFNI
jgi:hypothetical protein